MAVRVYVVVWAGETETEVPVTVPMPEILSEVALLTFQERVADWPVVIVESDAVKLEITGACGWTGDTVTVTDWVAVPPLPDAVRV